MKNELTTATVNTFLKGSSNRTHAVVLVVLFAPLPE